MAQGGATPWWSTCIFLRRYETPTNQSPFVVALEYIGALMAHLVSILLSKGGNLFHESLVLVLDLRLREINVESREKAQRLFANTVCKRIAAYISI